MSSSAQTLLAQAQAARSQGKLAQAEQLYRAALAFDRRQPDALYRLAEVLEEQGQPAAAIACLEEILVHAPGHVQTLHYLGLLLAQVQRYDEAATRFRQAIAGKPDYVRAHNNLGNVLRKMGRTQEAVAAFTAATRLQPDYVVAHFNLGALLREQGRYAEAEAAFREALRLQPTHRESLVALAAVLRQSGKVEESAACYRRAIELQPRDSEKLVAALANVLVQTGATDEARALCAQARSRAPELLRLALPQELALRPVYASVADVEQSRARYAEGLHRLRGSVDSYARAGVDEVVDALNWNNFYLAYQGENDKVLQQEYAGFVADLLDRVWPEYRRPLAPSARERAPRVGYASSFFYNSTVGAYFENWIAGLDSERYEIHVYHLHPGMNPLAEGLRRHAHVFRELGAARDARTAARAIRGDDLDILVYPELGMDGLAFLLAALRLAPVQCAGWGHPVTTGHASVDYFLSSAAMEPPDAALHYSETLVPLPGIGTCYPRPQVPEPASRAAFHLPEDEHLYLCPQSIYKIHPDNDELFARVLDADRNSVLVFFEGRSRGVTGQFTARLAGRGIDVQGRLRMLPYLAHRDYLQVNRLCDVMLDTVRWSGGNTTLDALAMGLPTVTMPGAYMRGRQSHGMLTLLGIPELIAGDLDEYVQIAIRLANDVAWRGEIVARLEAGSHLLFGDTGAIGALQDFYDRACGARG